MTRTFSIGVGAAVDAASSDGLGQIDAALVERAAEIAPSSGAPLAFSAREVLERRDAARGDHRDRDRARERRRGRDVRALHRAVAVDVGVDDRGDAGVLEAAREVDGRRRRWSRPSPRPRPGRRARRCRRRCGPG